MFVVHNICLPIPSPLWATRSTTLTSVNHSPTRRHTAVCPSALYSENRDSSMKRTPLQNARCHRKWAFVHSSQLWHQTAVRSRPRWGWPACRWSSLRRFLTVCAENYLVMQTDCCISCPGGWSQTILEVKMLDLDVLPNSLKCFWRWLIVEKWTFKFTGNSSGGHSCRSTCQLHIPSNLRHLWHCAVW